MNYETFIKEYKSQAEEDKLHVDCEWPEGNFEFVPVVNNDGEVIDMVNSPSHYTRGGQEAIVTIEEAIADAPDAVMGLLQGNALKYLLRLWNKENSLQDAKKAKWYLERLIVKLDAD